MDLHGALVSSPGMGHAVPIIELGKRLLTHHGFDRVTVFLVTTDISRSKSQLGLSMSETPGLVIEFISLEVPEQDLTGSVLNKLATMMRMALPEIRSAVMELEPRPTVLVADLMGIEALAVARDLEVTRKFVLVTTSAWFLALTVYMASLDKGTLYKLVSSREPLLIPGCSPVQLDPVQDPSSIQDLTECLRMGTEILAVNGVFVNTWHELECEVIGSFLDPEKLGRAMGGVPIYPVGPLIRPVEPGLKHEVLDWLEQQPEESVVFVSFGSGGSLTSDQTTELAWGLELSRQRFVWVVRPPAEDDPSASMFNTTKNQATKTDFLPDGFLERTEKTGLVVRTWAPQEEILAHRSTGAFVSHCGWNSILESVANGVPMIAWPLHSEQKMNAWMVSEEWKIAVRATGQGTVRREEIAEMLRRVMEEEEGKEMRKNVQNLKNTAQESLMRTESKNLQI
ncbi:PREDICTED: UDP-glycosyltransferase 72C1 [Tarenaya hassleriana]|uniref:UDP-glycosyltransferase 72C1 n=1 Tax=Tarenaya hassleriana TaxID=28532 RepID=UPI00053C48F2|nr:PREDICTED: UDP-glycosyltransferase 72C1 [Tarenaya hassleriana]